MKELKKRRNAFYCVFRRFLVFLIFCGTMMGRLIELESRKNMLTTEDFDFDLPEELIAQTPLKERTSSRLLVMNRQTGELDRKSVV